jgi:hypothetical protein
VSVGEALSLRHHVFTNTASGYATVVSPRDGTRDEIRELERHAIYALPQKVSNETRDSYPIKHMAFRVGPSLAVSRAVYLGLDATGRGGNFCCHTVLVPVDDARASFEGPADLIAALEASGVFADAPTSRELPEHIEVAASPASRIDPGREAMRALVTFAFSWRPGLAPALLVDPDGSALGVITAAFDALPPSLRWARPLDSYAYSVPWQELAFASLPAEGAYRAGDPPWSLRIDLQSGTAEWREAPLVDPLADYLAGAPAVARAAAASCVDLVEEGLWDEVPENLRLAGTKGVSVLFSRYRARLLERIAQAGDTALYQTVASLITGAEFEGLASDPRFGPLWALVEVRERAVETVAASFESSHLLRMIPSDPVSLEVLVARIEAMKPPSRLTTSALTLIGALDPLDTETERRLLRAIVSATRPPLDSSLAARSAGILGARSTAEASLIVARLFTLGILGDKTAFPRLASSPVAGEVLAVEPWMITRSLHGAIADRGGVRQLLDALVARVAAGELAARELTDACTSLLCGRYLDEKEQSELAKELWSALEPVQAQRWAGGLLDLADEHRPHGMFRRGGRKDAR